MVPKNLEKLILYPATPAFKNNRIYTGSFQITGNSSAGGTDIRTVTIPLAQTPDLLAALFNGYNDPPTTSDPRPNNAWFRKGAVWVKGTNSGDGYVDYPLAFEVSCRIIGPNAIIRLENVKQFTSVLTLTPTTVFYRIIDYSVF